MKPSAAFVAALALWTAADPSETGNAQEARATRVLFIGNSYTYFNNLPGIVESLAEAAGHPLETRMVAPGGWRLKDHHEKGDALRALHDGHWDFVVLQEQSTLGTSLYVDGLPRVGGDEVFRPWAEKWAAEAAAAGTKPVFYLTWARKKSPEDQATLDAAVLRAAAATHAAVAPVGPAWALAREKRPEVELYFEDGSHPAAAGSYLAACTLYATLFGASPVGLPAKASGAPVDLEREEFQPDKKAVLVELGPEDARALQEAAWAAVQGLAQKPVALEGPLGARLPPLPRGAALTERSLAGTWSGSLALAPSGPAELTLYLEPPPSKESGWSGYVELRFHSRDVPDRTVDFEDLKVGESELSFSMAKLLFDLDVRFRAVLAGGELAGQAEASGPSGDSPTRLLGSWTLRRKAD